MIPLVFEPFAVGLILLQLAAGQLLGNITSPGNAFIITVEISNPTSSTISILAWNNIFDFSTQLPVSFSVEDDQGNAVQMASTYAMRAGMTKDDLYDLLPGQTFTRIFDLRQVLQSVPSGSTTLFPKAIKILLPSGFKGISHSGTYSIPVEAASDLVIQPPKLGDFSAAKLQDVTLTSEFLSLALYFPIFPNPSDQANLNDGLRLNVEDCQGQNATDLLDAIFDAGVYANSLYIAATTQPSPIFSKFFDTSKRASVSGIATSMKSVAGGIGPHVDVYCTDGYDLCKAGSNILGYTFAPSWLGQAFLVLCPSARSLGRAPEPCSADVNAEVSATASRVMFHLLVTLNNVVGSMMDGTVFGSLACQQMKNSSIFVQTRNPDTYAQLSVAQWNYGLGGAPYNGPVCLPADGTISDNRKRTAISQAFHSRRLKTVSHQIAPRQFTETYSNIQSNWIKQGLVGTQQCTGNQAALLQFAIQNARMLAASARDYPFAQLWNLYFNGDSNVENNVVTIFDNISKWNTNGATSGVSFFCDPYRRSSECISGRTLSASWDYTGEASIILCPSFFYYPPALQCLNPSVAGRPDVATDMDQGGAILHELLHVPWVANNLIIGDAYNDDGSSADCYTYACTTKYAADRYKPLTNPRNLPEHIAANYELYAYAVRASNAGCSWSNYPGYDYGFGKYGVGHN